MKKVIGEKIIRIGGAALIIFVVGTSYLGYQYYILNKSNATLQTKINELENTIAKTEANLQTTAEEGARLATELEDTSQKLKQEEDRFNSAKNIFEEITDTVGNLEKLAKLDPQLLQKYSKAYFLNEHYVPDDLTDIPLKNLYHEDRPEQIHSKVWPFLKDLLDEAESDGVELFVASAFRSFGEQKGLKSGYVFTYGAGTANQFSAEQGFSEHQLGTTVDFLTTGIGGTLSGFETTQAYKWLQDNAHKYGFTLSYPEGNTYYQFEPWHWRFVGTDLARDLHRDRLFFYDFPQRDIDGYLLEIFD